MVSPSAVSPNYFVGTFFGALVFYLSGTSQLSSGDASDSICPKGWGIAEYDGDGSYEKLIANVYGINKTNIGITQSYEEYDIIFVDDFMIQYSLSFFWTGNYQYTTGKLNNRKSYAYFWESKLSSKDIAWNMRFDPNGIRTQYAVDKRNGFSVRCVGKF